MVQQPLFFDVVNEGDELPVIQKGPITRTQLVKYAGASGDFNPMHHDEVFAKNAGMPSVFAHGMLSMGFVGQLVTDWAGNDALKRLGVRFAAITWPGDVITCKGTVVKKYQKEGKSLVDCEFYTENQKGQKTVTGSATVQLPSKG
tara:strand:- start:214 stop:648 length:435 start_codon:yes stop_codon:yes gene_type:complete